jgi:hypothetical protein
MSSRLIIQPMSSSAVRASNQLVSWMGQGLNMGLHGGRRQDDRKDVVIDLFFIFYFTCVFSKKFNLFYKILPNL